MKYKHLKKELKEWNEIRKKVSLFKTISNDDIELVLRFLIDKHIEVIESIINSPKEDSDDGK